MCWHLCYDVAHEQIMLITPLLAWLLALLPLVHLDAQRICHYSFSTFLQHLITTAISKEVYGSTPQTFGALRVHVQISR